MTEEFFKYIIFFMLLFVVVAIQCAFFIAGRLDKREEENSASGDGKSLCSKCKVGKETYAMDEHSEVCPYISGWKDNKCSFYVPLDTVEREKQNSGNADKEKTN